MLEGGEAEDLEPAGGDVTLERGGGEVALEAEAGGEGRDGPCF